MKILSPSLNCQLQNQSNLITLLDQAVQDEIPISHMLFEKISLDNVNYKGIEYTFCKFVNCRFTNCFFENHNFEDVCFENCDLSACNFSTSRFCRVIIKDCKGTGAIFKDTIFLHTAINNNIFHLSNWNNIVFDKVIMNGNDFSDTWLSECKLKKLELYNVYFKKTNFFNTSLNKIDLTQCTLEDIGLSSDGKEVRGAIVNVFQAAELSRLLGVVIKYD